MKTKFFGSNPKNIHLLPDKLTCLINKRIEAIEQEKKQQEVQVRKYEQNISAYVNLIKEIKAINNKINIKAPGEREARYISSLLSVENGQNIFVRVQEIFADDKDKYKNAATNVYEVYKLQQSTLASKEVNSTVDKIATAIKVFIRQGKQLIALSQEMSKHHEEKLKPCLKSYLLLQNKVNNAKIQDGFTTYGTFTL
jgi:hypothetical protein